MKELIRNSAAVRPQLNNEQEEREETEALLPNHSVASVFSCSKIFVLSAFVRTFCCELLVEQGFKLGSPEDRRLGRSGPEGRRPRGFS